MQLAEYSVPKIKPVQGEEDGREGGLFFCSLFEGVSGLARRYPAAKLLVVSDKESYQAVSALPKNPRFVFLVLDAEDCLPLFSMPDSVSCAIAVGGEKTLWAVRYFAEMRGIPSAVFPLSGSLSGRRCGGFLPPCSRSRAHFRARTRRRRSLCAGECERRRNCH